MGLSLVWMPNPSPEGFRGWAILRRKTLNAFMTAARPGFGARMIAERAAKSRRPLWQYSLRRS